jgi:hypothetical protein
MAQYKVLRHFFYNGKICKVCHTSYYMKYNSIFIFLGLCFLALLPSSALASTIIPLSSTHTLLTHTFTETFLNRDVIIPILADTNASHQPLTLGYAINGIPSEKIVSTTAVVLSQLPIKNGGYAAIEGTKNTFMLVVLIEHTSEVRPSQIAISTLPFLTTTNDRVDGQTARHFPSQMTASISH